MRYCADRRSGKSVLVVVIGVAALLGGVVGGAVLAPKLSGKHAPPAAGKRSGAVPASEATEGKPGHSGETDAGQIIDLGEFLVNLRTASGLRYLQAQVALSLTGLPEPKPGGHEGGAAKPSLPEAQLAIVKDRVVTVLSAANFDRARSPEGREALKRQIQESLTKALPDYEVKAVLFTSFVMQ